jgi:hypothetical protein
VCASVPGSSRVRTLTPDSAPKRPTPCLKKILYDVMVPVPTSTGPGVPASDGIFQRGTCLMRCVIDLEDLNLNPALFVLLLLASLPDCSQNQTAVSD